MKINAELEQALELARTLDEIIVFSENHHPREPIVLAATRIRLAICGALLFALETLNYPALPADEYKRLKESLEAGRIPKSKALLGDLLPKLLDQEISSLESRLVRLRARARQMA